MRIDQMRHRGVYGALNCGEVRIGRLRRALAGLPLRAWHDGVLARQRHLGTVNTVVTQPYLAAVPYVII
jgi:hypothetical protein